VPQADVTIGSRRALLSLDPEWNGQSAFLGFKESPTVMLRVRRNLSASLGAASLTLLLVSAILISVRARSAPRSLE
jgi:hypothetical protein